ncbi:MAG: zinc ribbon domain-containing protein [Ruminiclostridium sp.]|nr:zinc ribbon domain-containing protein [Ruminiclostridium sp.]
MSVLDNFTRKVSDTAKAAAKKSGNVVELTRLNMNIGAEEEKIKKLHSEMGKLLYDVYQDGEQINEDILPFCEKIDVIYGTIEEMKTKILELRNVKACAECGHELEMDMVFCYKCGSKQDADVVDTGGDNS